MATWKEWGEKWLGSFAPRRRRLIIRQMSMAVIGRLVTLPVQRIASEGGQAGAIGENACGQVHKDLDFRRWSVIDRAF